MSNFLSSSADANKISLTVKGILLSLVPIIMILTGLTEAEIQPIIDTIVQIVFLATTMISAGQVLYGLMRKIYLKRWSQ